MRWLAALVAALALLLVALAGANSSRAAAGSTIYLPYMPNYPTPTPTVSWSPFWTVTSTPTVTPTQTLVPSCAGRQVETIIVDPQKGGETAPIDTSVNLNVTAWIAVSGGDGVIDVAFYNQWQNTPFVEVDTQGIVQDVVPHPAASTKVELYNPTLDQPGAQSKSVQVTYQACQGQWPPGVSSPTPTS